MTAEKDHYQILEVGAKAGRQEIRQAYHRLVRQYHPDSNAPSADEERFLEIQEAYEVLGDPKRRRAYDRWRVDQGMDRDPLLRMELIPSHDVLPSIHETQILYTFAELLPGKGIKTEPLPLSLCLVLDRSTSMDGAKLAQLKSATYQLVDALDDQDVLSVITFSDRASVVVPSYYGSDKAAIKAAVTSISASGGTEIYQGLRAGLDQLLLQRPGRSIDHLIMLTDGQTYGDEELCIRLAEEAGRLQVRITALGMGTDWNDALLDEIASRSNGISVFIEAPEQIATVFYRQVKSLQGVYGQRARFTARLTSQVHLREVFQVLPTVSRLSSQDDMIRVGNLGMETPNAFLFEWLVDSHPPGVHQLFSMEILADIPSLEMERVAVEQRITARFSESVDPGRHAIPDVVTNSMERIAAFRLQEKAQEDIRSGRVEDASRRLQNLATRLLSLGERQLAQDALLEARRVSATGQLSPIGHKRLKYGTRIMTSTRQGKSA